MEKNQTNANNVTLILQEQANWENLKNAHRGNIKQMQPVPLCIFSCKSSRCSRCDFASSHTSALRRHLKTHNGERSKKCNQCDYASSEAGNLGRHLKMHSREKPHKCNQCDSAFSTRSHLRRHLKIHSGRKPYKCRQCDCILCIRGIGETFENPQ